MLGDGVRLAVAVAPKGLVGTKLQLASSAVIHSPKNIFLKVMAFLIMGNHGRVNALTSPPSHAKLAPFIVARSKSALFSGKLL